MSAVGTSFYPGQKLWWTSLNRSPGLKRDPGHEVTVVKVGRRWVTLDNGHRIGVHGGLADGGDYASPGCCWPSEAAYLRTIKMTGRWEQFHRYISTQYSPPLDCTIERIEAASRLLQGGAEPREEAIARLRAALESIKQISRPTSDVWSRADRALRETACALPAEMPDAPLFPCDCTGYNGGQCYNCLNGFHVGCPHHCSGSAEPLRAQGLTKAVGAAGRHRAAATKRGAA